MGHFLSEIFFFIQRNRLEAYGQLSYFYQLEMKQSTKLERTLVLDVSKVDSSTTRPVTMLQVLIANQTIRKSESQQKNFIKIIFSIH